MPANHAAWLVGAKTHPLEVKEAPFPEPTADDIVIKTAAIALNPVDPFMQNISAFPVAYPYILGFDGSGVVEAVGSAVTKFKPGQRVAAMTAGFLVGEPTRGTFQEYFATKESVTFAVPDNISLEAAATLPLSLATATACLYNKDGLALDFPEVGGKPSNGETVLIWGGATSVAASAIQLAVAAGYEVISTASAKNFDHVKKLGATQVFDYGSSSIVEDITAALKGKKVAGAVDCSGIEKSVSTIAEVFQGLSDAKKYIACVREPPALPEGVTAAMNFADHAAKAGHTNKVFLDFVTPSLESGKFIPAPPPKVVGKGLESLQEATDLIWKGVSNTKLIVSLE